jgi:hypothetical protein
LENIGQRDNNSGDEALKEKQEVMNLSDRTSKIMVSLKNENYMGECY